MSRIDRLAIAGVRSFGEEKPETIKFNTPLTLIVGYNGSGKTTIIECLKYATTGQFPPNAKVGAAFIHDAKLTGFKEVKAQVRLGFQAVAKHKMTVTRSLLATVGKNKTASMKTVDCSLLIIKDGERTVVSSKTAVMDSVMPQYIGVSHAVLDNVIFCHQDESLWPMSEPSVLKKKFDEIFEALKYTAAVKNIIEIQKGQKAKLIKWKADHDHEKVNKDRGDRAQQRSIKLSEDIETQRTELDALKRDIATAERTKVDKWRLAQDALGVMEQLRAKETSARNIQQSIDRLAPNLDIRDEPDEWLTSTLDRYEEQVQKYEEEARMITSQFNELKRSVSVSDEQLTIKAAEKGKHDAAKENFEGQVASRAEMVRIAAHQHSLRGYDGDLDETQVGEFVNRIRKLLREKDRELEQTKTTADGDIQIIQNRLNEQTNRKNNRTQAKLDARQSMSANERARNAKQIEANAINVDEGIKAGLEKAEADVAAKLNNLEAEYLAADWSRQLKSENGRLDELENERAELSKQFKQVNKLATDQAELEIFKRQATETQRKLDTMKSLHSNKLTAFLGDGWERLAQEFQSALDQQAESLTEAKRVRDVKGAELREVELKLTQSRARLLQKEADFLRRQKVVLDSTLDEDKKPISTIDEYLSQLEGLQEHLTAVQTELAGLEHISKHYDKSRAYAVKYDACSLCERKFAGNEKSAALMRIDNLVNKASRDALESEMEETKQELDTAAAARPDYEIARTLSLEISEIEREIGDLERKKSSRVKRAESQDDTAREEEDKYSQLSGLTTTVKSITEDIDALSKLKATVASLSAQHNQPGDYLSSEEIEQKQSSCEDRIRTLKVKIEKMSIAKDQAKEALTKLEIEKPKAASRLDKARRDLEKKQTLMSEVDQLRESNIDLRNTLQDADADLEALEIELSQTRVEYEDAKKRGYAKQKEIQSQKDKLYETSNQFKQLEENINRYIEDGGAQQLAACLRTIKVLEQDRKRLDADLTQVTQAGNKVEKMKSDSDRTKRSIIDNIQYRKDVHDLKEVKKEISEMKSRNVTGNFEQLQRDAGKAEDRCTKLGMELATKASSIREKDKILEEALTLWETDYKDAAQNYREARVKVGTASAAIEDLEKYSGALESAVLKYHTLKMEEINRFAGELWQQTYQGTDIDTIMIRSENENAASKKSYNYRVVMVKSNAEMDMRGRCSAGQKVLASIIIRLALAECFGVNCGIIALDEPTTNLDSDNIQALARSLHALIRNRKQQANFQLLIITHDEAFLREMKCQEFCETYFAVSRNDKQNSVINEEPISKLMGS